MPGTGRACALESGSWRDPLSTGFVATDLPRQLPSRRNLHVIKSPQQASEDLTPMSSNVLNGGQVIVDYLIREKVPYVFGLCGHGNIGFIDALYERAERDQDDLGPSRERRRLHGRRLLPRQRPADRDLHLVRPGLGQSADRARQRLSRFRAVPRGDRQRADQPVQPRRVPGALSAIPGRLSLDRARHVQARVSADARRHGAARDPPGVEDHGHRPPGSGRARRAVRHLQGRRRRGDPRPAKTGAPTSPAAAAPIPRASPRPSTC